MSDWLMMKISSFCKLRTLFLLLSLVLSGCAGGPFSSYDQRLARVRNRMSSGDSAAALKKLNPYKQGLNSQLYWLERGRVNQTLRNHHLSKADFEAAIASFKKEEEKAKYTVTGALAQTGSLVVSDKVIPYSAEPYERIFVYHYQALNYLLSREVEKAAVEVRRALFEQRQQELRYEEELLKAQNEIATKGGDYINSVNIEQALRSAYAEMDQVAHLVNSSFVNPYLYYLAGLVQEIEGDYSNAYVSYRKAVQSAPGNHTVQDAVMELAYEVDRGELRKYENRFKRKYIGPLKESEGELIVLFEQGFVPMKEEVIIPFPTGYGITTLAFPVYNDREIRPIPLKIYDVDRKLVGKTDTVCNVQAMAYKALREKMAITVVRSLLRVAGKVALQYQASKEMGALGEFISSIWNIVSEHADTRSWATLPANVQVFRTRMPVGKHRLLTNDNKEILLDIKKGRKTLVLVNMMGTYTSIQSVNL